MMAKQFKRFPTIEEMHEDWEARCVPPHFTKTQRTEIKLAFMSGIAALFRTMRDDVPKVPIEEGCEYMDKLEKQIANFYNEL